MYVSDRNVQQVETLLTVICGRKPCFNMWVSGHDQGPYKLSYKIVLERQEFLVKGEGDTVHECIRSFYGELLLLFAKHHMMYFGIAKFIYRNCKKTVFFILSF